MNHPDQRAPSPRYETTTRKHGPRRYITDAGQVSVGDIFAFALILIGALVFLLKA